ncbi:hypothetical protein L596_001298 [Steinernema carpocapsae]|uniref:Uncharacterized protein n=1 Tax=Steinernema carpocapsae TaxID=34508 RepID=A0A4U8UKV1_STECR|nr:hypothetical protein L596_001298 [Steinernema carpocapsae]
MLKVPFGCSSIDLLTSEAEDSVPSSDLSLTALKGSLKQPKGVSKPSECDHFRAHLTDDTSRGIRGFDLSSDRFTPVYPTPPGLPFRIFELKSADGTRLSIVRVEIVPQNNIYKLVQGGHQ